MEKYLNENAIKVALAFVSLLGTVALLGYFFMIEYFPVVDLKSASLLVSLAFVIAILQVMLSTTLLLPYIFIGMFFQGPDFRTRGPELRRACGLALLAALTAVATFELALRDNLAPLNALLIYAAVYLLVVLGCLLLRALLAWRWHGANELFGCAALVGFAQLFPYLVLSMLLEKGTAPGAAGDVGRFLPLVLGLSLSAVAGCGMLWWCYTRSDMAHATVLGALVTLLLPLAVTMSVGAPGVVPMTMARIAKIGNMRVERMMLGSGACDSIGPLLHFGCDGKQPAPIELCNVHIMSRVGSETFVLVPLGSAGGARGLRVARVFLPSTDIKGMQVDFSSRDLHPANLDSYLSGRTWQCAPPPQARSAQVTFEDGEARLTDEARAGLQRLIAAAGQASDRITGISVLGHADSAESNAGDRLSQRRADTVALYLREQLRGVAPELDIGSASAGAGSPLIRTCGGEDDDACAAPNRRVEVRLDTM